jgi:hypothetical protein
VKFLSSSTTLISDHKTLVRSLLHLILHTAKYRVKEYCRLLPSFLFGDAGNQYSVTSHSKL